MTSTTNNAQIAVMYLARKAEGLDAFRAFMQTYKKYRAGVQHDLVVIFKGYENKQDLEQAQAVFSPYPILSIELPDEGFDIGCYLEAAKQLSHKYICCFNTFAKILDDDWLQKLYANASLPNVGIVGGTGSYEGLLDTTVLFQKAQWLIFKAWLRPSLRQKLIEYFAFTFPPSGLPSEGHFKQRVKHAIRKIIGSNNISRFEKSYAKWWNRTKKDPELTGFCVFPAFPNPHIRSNAFMMERERFVSFDKPTFTHKLDACAFESGHEGMTRQLLNEGLRALIVGKDGIGYDVPEWGKSRTFRCGNQSNLLFADNHTNVYTSVNEKTREIFQLITWGEKALSSSTQLPNLGVKFQ